MATYLLGDCLEVMKTLTDKSIDCFVCDLPYGQLHAGRKEADKGQYWDRPVNACAWDVKLNLAAFWEQVKRLAKDDHTPVLMFCNTKFGIDLINSNPSWFRYDLVWDKGHGVSFLSANRMPMKSHEMVYVFSKKGAFYRRVDVPTDKPNWVIDRSKDKRPKSTQYGVKRSSTNGVETGKDGLRCPLSVISIAGTFARNAHPTQKPIELYRWLLERYVPEKGTVLDPTAGSFNAIKAARSLGYKAIGIEKDPGFFWKAAACKPIPTLSHV